MSRAVVDPDELRRVAVMLNEIASSVRQSNASLNNSFNSLKDVWRDEKRRQFENAYSKALPRIEIFCKNAEALAQHLRNKEKPLRRYQENRY
jgi:uncharacterized protein YukE